MNSIEARPVELSGIDGSNPLGFLAALGTLVALHRAGETQVKLGWKKTTKWTPVLIGLSSNNPIEEISEKIEKILHGNSVSSDAAKERDQAQKAFDDAKKEAKKKEKEINNRKLRGHSRDDAIARELQPLLDVLNQKRNEWLVSLKKAVPSPELVIGKHLDCSVMEYRDQAKIFLDTSNQLTRATLDLMSDFASDACVQEKNGKIEATPFCFISGSGHQYFLDTVRQLMETVETTRIQKILFEPWRYQDEKLSLRWDPLEDRRYALMDKNPTASDNKSKTEWMANLLAYQALVLFPSMPTQGGLKTTAWTREKKNLSFVWPIWDGYLGLDVIRSILQTICIVGKNIRKDKQKGISSLFAARRFRNGKYLNFSPAKVL